MSKTDSRGTVRAFRYVDPMAEEDVEITDVAECNLECCCADRLLDLLHQMSAQDREIVLNLMRHLADLRKTHKKQ